MGRPRHRFRDAGAGHGRARQGRQRDLEDLQPVLEVEPPDRRDLHRRAEGALPASRSWRTTPTCSARASPSRAPAPTTACRRRTTPRPGSSCAPSATATNGSSTARSASSPTPASASCSSSTRAPTRTRRCKQGTTMFLVPRDTPGFRIGKVFNKSGWRFYQNGEMIFENARVPHANVVGAGERLRHEDAAGRRPHRRRPVRRPRARRQRARRLRRRLRAWR